jgi:uncharacterized protein involved in response to NO
MKISLTDIAREPFRVFFPAGVLAGIVGVSLWPLYLKQWILFYPGPPHARLMAFGLFGAFIFGFLGTAMPRMLSAKPLRGVEVSALVVIHLTMVAAFALGKTLAGDALFLLLVALFVLCMIGRARQRKDTPPPGFALIALSFASVATATFVAIVSYYRELSQFWMTLHRLLAYQGFVLLPILGISPFILPRFFGIQSAHDFPEMLLPIPGWWKKALIAFTAGALIIGSFLMEATGWLRVAYTVRFGTTLAYLILELPLGRAPGATQALGISIRIAFAAIVGGFLAVSLFPFYRVALLHLTLMGGFATITFVVATRVVFGHSGNLALLKRPNRWLLVSVGLMLFGMATRISGDFWPAILISHYTYGALLWIAGVLLWTVCVLPKVFITDTEG